MVMHADTALPPDLAALQVQIEDHARRYGLDFFPTIFELVDHRQLHEIAAYGGFPTRYPHWRFGMEYEQLAKGYEYGLQKIYELVINNDPCYAYLLRSNHATDQKLVMAHVYGHCDFFKNNDYFRHTSRKMMDEMANHAQRVRRHMDRVGVDEVEGFIDACLSLEDLIDVHGPFIRRRDPAERDLLGADEPPTEPTGSGKLPSKDYLDPFVNPPAALREEQVRRKAAADRQEKRFPAEPVRDVMRFLLEHAPLKPWQADILSLIRDEAYYFLPQAQTKIMNEGWASYWHSTIMTQRVLEPSEVIHYCDHHSGTMASSPQRLNPYKLGLELFRDIEERWNRGQFGPEWEACDDPRERERWDTGAGLGRAKLFEVRRVHCDLTFIDNFLTLDFCRRHKLFSFGFNPEHNAYEIESRAFPQVKERLLFNLTNIGRPIIEVADANYKNRGELFLEHRFHGVELQHDYARDTLVNLHRLWTRPVHIATVLKGEPVVISFDGREPTTKKTDGKKQETK